VAPCEPPTPNATRSSSGCARPPPRAGSGSAELDQRVHRALTALTYADLSALVADLPGPRLGHPARRALTASGGRSVAAWSWRVARTHPGAVVLLIPFVMIAGTILLTITIVSMVFVAIAMALGAQAPPSRRRRRHTAASIS
jgi:hypothetical protein